MTVEESAALATFWKDNAKLAEAVADRWRDSSKYWRESCAAHKVESKSWRRIALAGWDVAVLNAACAGYWWFQ